MFFLIIFCLLLKKSNNKLKINDKRVKPEYSPVMRHDSSCRPICWQKYHKL